MTPPPIPPVLSNQSNRTIKYSLTRADLLRWHFYLFLRNRVIMAVIVIFSVGIAWSDSRRPEFAAYPLPTKILYAVFLMIIMYCFVGSLTMAALALRIMLKKLKGFLGEHELEIRDEGLVERTAVNESLSRWAGFHKIVARGRYLYIYVTDNNVYLVPRRYFASEQAERAFREELERRIKSQGP